MAKYIPINFTLIKNPANWLIVWVVLLIGAFAIHLVLPPSSQS